MVARAIKLVLGWKCPRGSRWNHESRLREDGSRARPRYGPRLAGICYFPGVDRSTTVLGFVCGLGSIDELEHPEDLSGNTATVVYVAGCVLEDQDRTQATQLAAQTGYLCKMRQTSVPSTEMGRMLHQSG